ncbi:MAG: YceH family protein [Chitinivibrionales bacterium]
MDVELNEIEVRVLGSLVEKDLTTPEYYPLSLNALTAACNQKSNREPVMSLDESEIVRALDSLKNKHLVWKLDTAAGRVPKYEHNLRPHWELSDAEISIICVLLLRGPQTVGEIKSRTGRMYDFSSLEEVEQSLKQLEQRDDGPFVTRLPLQPGRKEHRFMHLFSGEIELPEHPVESKAEPARIRIEQEQQRIAELEEQVSYLQNRVESLQQQFESFRSQFE